MSNDGQRSELVSDQPARGRARTSVLLTIVLTAAALVGVMVLITSPADKYQGWPQPSASPSDQTVGMGYGSDPSFRPQMQVTFTCDRDEGMIVAPEMLVDVEGAAYYDYATFWRSTLSHTGGTCSAAWQWLSDEVGDYIIMHTARGADSWSYDAASISFVSPMGDGKSTVSENEYGVLLVQVDDLPPGPQLAVGPNNIYMPARPGTF